MINVVNIIRIVGDLFELLAKIQYYEKTLTKRVKQLWVILVWAFAFVLDQYLVLNEQVTLNVIIYFVLAFLCIFLLYEDSAKKKAITIFFVCVFQMLGEIFANTIVNNLKGIDDNESIYLMGYMISKIIFFIFIRISIHFNKRKNEFNMGNKTFISILFVPLLCIVLVGIFELDHPARNHNPYYALFFYSIILIINYLMIIQYDDVQKMLDLNNRNRMLEEQKIYYIQQYEQTKKMWDLMSSMRHNMKNEYVSQSILLKDKEYEKLENLYHNKIGELEASKVVSKSGNRYIDTIVNYKVSVIKEMNADFECKVLVPEVMDIDSDDIIMILGNLLDNVIDAFENERLEKKTGRLSIVYEKSNLYIEVRNTYEGVRKTNRKGEYVTTKKSEEMHGLGIKAVNNVVKKYDGYLEIKEEDKSFIVTVLIQI